MPSQHERVVVGLDGSRDAEIALEWAVAFATAHGARVTPVHTWHYPKSAIAPWPLGSVVAPESAMALAATKAAERMLERRSSSAGTEAPIDPPKIVHGSPGPALVTEAVGAGLLVVGSRGLGAVRGALIGSVSSYSAAHAESPVAIIPAEAGTPRLKRIVVGHDGSERSDAALSWAIGAFPGAEVEVVHVWRYPALPEPMAVAEEHRLIEHRATDAIDQIVTKNQPAVDAVGSSIVGRVIEGDPRMKLNARAAEADVLVLGVQQFHSVRRIFLGSVAQAIVHHITAPTIIVPTSGDDR